MQGNTSYYGTAAPTLNRKSIVILLILVLFLIFGGVIGFMAAGVKHATLTVVVENDTGTTQDVRIFLNDDQVDVIRILAGSTGSVTLQVGWTSTTHGMYEVRASPVTTGWPDEDTRTVSDGQNLLITLRVR